MTYTITSDCTGCQRCLPVCPTGAITSTNGKMAIAPHLCNGCVGHYSVPQCAAVCPTNYGCIEVSSSSLYWHAWFETYDRTISQLKGTPRAHLGYWQSWYETHRRLRSQLEQSQNSYWHQWFTAYSQTLRSIRSPASA
ncbi:4Fe-4S binding protein [Oscillatoria sp. FACHB-1406]|uniref:4Fe-4S binding protein n=1 Tax=Oscillatoria sp. FACHB-1406 TaxID=2692846 RepID=UPI0016893CF2|nr:4Fe-4S binding protein [Oscillatoria sp. FACHB-1406]MBD2577783.1 4Fe-4S binding protein [Oscillatoria sp. FACHB-1406]